MSCQSRFDARYRMLGAGALGRPRGMVRGRRSEEGSGWGTCVYLWQIHVDIWQNQYNIVKLKKKKKKKQAFCTIGPSQLQSPGIEKIRISLDREAHHLYQLKGFPGSLVVKNTPANAGDIRDVGLIFGSGRFPGGGRGNPLQYSCLENPMVRGAWWATIHEVTKSWTRSK